MRRRMIRGRRQAPKTAGPSAVDIRRQLAFLKGEALPEDEPRPRPKFELKSPAPSESQVQAAVVEWAMRDARVHYLLRCNNGAAYDSDGRFFRFVSDGRGGSVTVLDLWGMCSWGQTLKVEVKATRAGWRSDDWFAANEHTPELELGESAARVRNQWREIQRTIAGHGAAGVVWGSDWPEQMDAILDNGLARYCAEAKRRMG